MHENKYILHKWNISPTYTYPNIRVSTIVQINSTIDALLNTSTHVCYVYVSVYRIAPKYQKEDAWNKKSNSKPLSRNMLLYTSIYNVIDRL